MYTHVVIRFPEFTDLEFDLLCRMLAKDSVKRASIMDIYQHPWVQMQPEKPRGNLPLRLINTQGINSERYGDALEEEKEDTHCLATMRRRRRWKKTALSIIAEDGEATEY